MHRDFFYAAPEGFDAVGQITHARILCVTAGWRQVDIGRARCYNSECDAG
jgi:hypothetical protein